MTDDTYKPIDEIDSLTCDILIEEEKMKQAKKMIEYYTSIKEFLIQAVGALKND
jgi:hypothetical protein